MEIQQCSNDKCEYVMVRSDWSILRDEFNNILKCNNCGSKIALYDHELGSVLERVFIGPEEDENFVWKKRPSGNK